MRDEMQIGELAAHFGLNPKTIRYYEEIGLLPQAHRSASGYRRYGERDVERLGFIRRAKTLGLSLDEIRALLSVQEKGSPPCGQVLGLIESKISAIDRRMANLVVFRAELATLQVAWTEEHKRFHGTTPAGGCPILAQQAEVEAHPESAEPFEPTMHR